MSELSSFMGLVSHTLNILIHNGNVKISDLGLSRNLHSMAVNSHSGVVGVALFIDPRKHEDENYSNLREDPIAGTPKQYIDLYSKCWDHEPNKRPSMKQILDQFEFS
ncbi:kinase-like protein [Gigaspora margarita]|uniref:Kinase-like protein n=1 Tax=Gigaspora margarita TaxID=4874 RepID=A0A8H4AN51_GIGMA|nr:kinase-like protein [Gigaspora margarita]